MPSALQAITVFAVVLARTLVLQVPDPRRAGQDELPVPEACPVQVNDRPCGAPITEVAGEIACNGPVSHDLRRKNGRLEAAPG